MKLTNIELLPSLRKRIKDQLAFVKRELDGIPADSLNFRPAKGKWSALECIEHLNLVFDMYLPRMRKGLSKPKLKTSESYSTGFFGDRMVSAMEPSDGEITYAMKTFKRMQPERSKRPKSQILKQFSDYMEELDGMIERSENVDLASIRIKSAIGSAIKFRLGDCFRFLIAHNERHLLQCRKVLKVLATNQ